jgi:hypothetical protein
MLAMHCNGPAVSVEKDHALVKRRRKKKTGVTPTTALNPSTILEV